MGNLVFKSNEEESDSDYDFYGITYINNQDTEDPDPIKQILDYTLLSYRFLHSVNDYPKLIVYDNEIKENITICNEQTIIRYIGRKFFLYPKRNIIDASMVDKWMDHYFSISVILNIYNDLRYKDGELELRYYLEKKINHYLMMIETNISEGYLENMSDPTIADLCWYNFILWLETQDKLTLPDMNEKYSFIKPYKKRMFEVINSSYDIEQTENGSSDIDKDYIVEKDKVL